MLIADEPDMSGNSGPTVVDDAKVAEVLKKLRSLDAPPGPLTGVTEIVVDSGSSEPTRIQVGSIEIDTGPVIDVESGTPEEIRSSQRTTAVGRSLSTPVAGQPITIPADLARGTLFGRSIHLPDVNAPEAAAVELSSGAVQSLDDGAESQPFPFAADNLVLAPPTSTPANIYDPGTGSYDSHPGTQLVERKSRAFSKMIAFVGGVGVIAAAFWYLQIRGKEKTPPAPPAVAEPAKPAVPAPGNDPMPPAAKSAATPPTAAALPRAQTAPEQAAAPTAPEKAPAPVEAENAPAAAAAAAADDEQAPAKTAPESSRSHSRRSSRSSGSTKPSAAAKPAKAASSEASDDAEPPAATKPGHGKKRGVDEDPDATMAPSM
jgi:hypothetical protein